MSTKKFTPLEIMPRLRGRSRFGGAKARCSALYTLPAVGRHAVQGSTMRFVFVIIPRGLTRCASACAASASLGFERQGPEILKGEYSIWGRSFLKSFQRVQFLEETVSVDGPVQNPEGPFMS